MLRCQDVEGDKPTCYSMLASVRLPPHSAAVAVVGSRFEAGVAASPHSVCVCVSRSQKRRCKVSRAAGTVKNLVRVQRAEKSRHRSDLWQES